jgi:ligand-binding SRPBCC domain-containing protein
MPYHFQSEQLVQRPLPQVFAFFSEAANLQELTPKWLHFQVLDVTPKPIQQGTLIRYRLRLHGLPLRWTSRITDWNPPHGFTDVQVSCPYSVWEHHHKFIDEGGNIRIVDDLHYDLPFGPLGKLAHWLKVRADVEKIFAFRKLSIQQRFG